MKKKLGILSAYKQRQDPDIFERHLKEILILVSSRARQRVAETPY